MRLPIGGSHMVSIPYTPFPRLAREWGNRAGGGPRNPAMSRARIDLAALFVVALAVAHSAIGPCRPRASLLPTARPAVNEAPAARLLFFGRLDVNTASAKDLQAVPGLGALRAARIIEERDRRSGFRQHTDLLAVPGIGAATLAQLRGYLEIAPPLQKAAHIGP